jgi:UDP-glucuronate decarboxylase
MFANIEHYQKSLQIFSHNIDWQQFNNKKILIIGASGLIGTYMIDILMYNNKKYNLNIRVIANGRNEKSLRDRFKDYLSDSRFTYVIGDINANFKYDQTVDYIFHLASNTHPRAYATHPIETLMTNIEGTYNLLNYAKKYLKGRFIFPSSVEIYGQASETQKKFSEQDCGYIDCNTFRACYNEGKRAGESLCQAFIKEYNLDIVIPRLCRVYGPTLKLDDSKALSQFLKNGVAKENIVLKSKGTQYFSYLYVGDIVNALLFLAQKGARGEAYNVADKDSDIRLANLAQNIATIAGTKVVFDLPDKQETVGYSKAINAILDATKISKLGWKCQYTIKEGLEETLRVL